MEMHIREKPHQANSHKQEPKDNQKEKTRNLFEQTCHIGKINYNIKSKWQTSNVHIFLWDCNMHIAYYSLIIW